MVQNEPQARGIWALTNARYRTQLVRLDILPTSPPMTLRHTNPSSFFLLLHVTALIIYTTRSLPRCFMGIIYAVQLPRKTKNPKTNPEGARLKSQLNVELATELALPTLNPDRLDRLTNRG